MSIYESLNPVQQEAVYHTEGPLLILAGAGSGKTRVLTHRIAYLIDECQVNPWNILAITFTNKAAGEMRERVDQIVDFGAEDIWVSTFHSTCVRILRRYIDRLGYDRSFTIYDGDDQKTVIKEVCKKLNIDTKIYKERTLLSAISSAKDEMIGPKEYLLRSEGDYARQRIAQVYEEYQKRLRSNNALDFDDLLFKTVELFKTDAEVLNYYQDRFKYIMVDEYQDTNTVQFQFVSLLAAKYRNLCVVGDDDQSIYKFRGANIHNILDFEKTFPDAKVIKLEQNYRSTKTILDAANGVIHHNQGRKDKTLWTDNEQGVPIALNQYQTEYEEAMGIVNDIAAKTERHEAEYKDFAVLYRTNAQSRVLEEKFVTRNIPYRVVGGVNFYQRKEIKDILAYLKIINNGQDDVAVRRVVNVPKRGIGATTVTKAAEYADQWGISLYEAFKQVDGIPGLGRAAAKINGFVNLIQVFRTKAEYMSLAELYDEVLEDTGYLKELQAEQTDEATTRIENLDELRNKIVAYEEETEQPSLNELLEQIALVADVDNMDDSDNKVILMTLHSAKGLEFPYVYLCGMEDGLFPSYMTIVNDDPMEIEEERRLCYVGITRAMKKLTLSYAMCRMMHGQTQYNKISRFVKEIPPQLIGGSLPRERFSRKVEDDLPWNTGSDSNGISGFGGSRAGTYGSGSRMGTGVGNRGIRQSHKFDVSAFAKKGGDMKKTAPDYEVGDTVKHIKFGTGVVQTIKDGGKDYEVTVDFPKYGPKKMFAGFAKLKKV